MQEARHADAGVGYVDPSALLQHMKSKTISPAETQHLAEIASVLVNRMLSYCSLDADIQKNCQAAAISLAHHILQHVWRDRTAVRSLALPNAIWAGTGGKYEVRLLALEILRRGGTVSLFDHGGTAAMRAEEDSTALALRELAVSTHYVLPTTALMDVSETQSAVEWARPFGFAGLQGGRGEAQMLKLPLSKKKAISSPPHVLYPSSLLGGFRSTGVMPMPDIVYLDLQMRLAESLAKMPINLICKPHPEGNFLHGRHPITDVAPVRLERFEELIEWTDVFVFDRCTSTTFWEAVCTDRPIIYIDTGVFQFGKHVEALIEKRCHVLCANYDDRNRAVIDAEKLQELIMSFRGPADPTAFQELLIG